jgi:membrane protease YdiL (CAAX protease family)
MESSPSFHPDSEPKSPPSSPEVPRRFRAGRALITYLIISVVEILAGLLASLFWMATHFRPGIHLKYSGFYPGMLLVAKIAATIVTLSFATRWAGDVPGDPVPLGLGEGRPRGRMLLAWGAHGALIAGIYVTFVFFRSKGHWGTGAGTLGEMAMRGGSSRAMWAFVGIMIAPIQEEVLYRGILFKGFAASWGTVASSIVVTLLFVAEHLSETGTHWPSIVWITTFSFVALAARLRTGSLRCSIAAHTAANMVIVGSTYALR